jgi:type IX secretion system PorP/SprF family membrane protein
MRIKLYPNYRSLFLSSVLILAGFLNPAKSQQFVQYTQYMYDLSLINPAYAGAYEALNVSLIHKDQWTGLEGAPQAQTLSAHTLFKKQQFGTGLIIHRETIGVHQNVHAGGNFAYHLNLNKKQILSVGIHAGIFNTQSDYQSLQTINNDPTANNEAFTGTEFNAGFGLLFRSKKIEIGYSIPTLLTRSVYINDSLSVDPTAVNHLIYGKYTFLINDKFKLSPSTLIKYFPKSPLSFDINIMGTYSEFISAGISYRLDESVDFLLRLQVTPQLEIGYAYDFPIGRISNFASASNEIMLRYLFKFKYDKVKSPR